MGFRELAHSHNKLIESHKELLKEHADTRRVVIQLIGSHNHFVNGLGGFFNRLRWLFRRSPAQPQQNKEVSE